MERNLNNPIVLMTTNGLCLMFSFLLIVKFVVFPLWSATIINTVNKLGDYSPYLRN